MNSPHICHAEGCTTTVLPRMLMCPRHWALVPQAMRAAIYAAYVPGQEMRKNPSRAWLDAAIAAINHVHAIERLGAPDVAGRER